MKPIYDCKVKVATKKSNGSVNLKDTHIVNLITKDMLHPDDFIGNNSIDYKIKMEYMINQLKKTVKPSALKYGIIVLSFVEKREINTNLNFK